MDNRRSIAIIAAFIAAVLVMMAGKSCSDNIVETNKSNQKKQSKNAVSDQITPPQNSPAPNQASPVQNNDEPATESTTADYIAVTNLIGDVVATIPVTTAEPEETPEEQAVTTRERSLLEEYNDNKNDDSNDSLNGFSHKKKKDDKKSFTADELPEGVEIETNTGEPPTMPEDFVLIVN